MTPEPSHNIHNWCSMMPPAEMTSPPHQQMAATTPALRGPARSSHPPQMAAADPRNTKKSVYVHPSMYNFQSQFVANTRARKPISLGHSSDSLMPMALDSGSQNTENPYAMPMHRWMASAAGGTSQRLNPGLAMVLSRSRKEGEGRTSVVDIMTGALRGTWRPAASVTV